MISPTHAKCPCQHCGVHLEFPIDGAGMQIDCPACGQKTDLFLPEEVPGASTRFSVSEIVAAITAQIAPAKVSLFYKLGLCLVSVVMIFLPVLYLAMVAVPLCGTWYWATHFSWLVTSFDGSVRLYVARCVLYGAGLLVGTVLVFFMVKPVFARRSQGAQPLALNAGAEPLLFALITEICRAVGAPFPRRIDVDCQFNASAGFRRGLRGLFGNDLVLTIGIPLAAAFTVRQFAGIVAHEFGHFTQGFGMRVSYIIRSVNGWFARVIYERDSWDLALEEWAQTEDAWAAIVVGCARLGVWFSRAVLKLLMFAGHGISCFMLRQMEYDADSYEIKLVGSEIFETAARRFALVVHAMGDTYKDMRTKFNLNRALPDDFPAYLLQHVDQVPPMIRSQIDDRLGLATTGVFDTHPSDGDRIRCARQAAEPGVFHLDGEARELFSNFAALSHQVTLLHYDDDLGLPVGAAILKPVDAKTPASVA